MNLKKEVCVKTEEMPPDSAGWSTLRTVTAFDADSCDVSESGQVSQAVECFSPPSLLVESLVEQLCKLLEADPTRQKHLYEVICQKLYQMKLIDATYKVEEFEFMRSHYQKAFSQLLSVANMMPLPSFRQGVQFPSLVSYSMFHHSRYQNEYEEIEFIAKGGFGQVFKVRNKLDGCMYAIKKIFMRYHILDHFQNSLLEVRMLAKLNHPNIVSYKAAWLEPFEVYMRCRVANNAQEASCDSLNVVGSKKEKTVPTSDEENLSYIVFETSERNSSHVEVSSKQMESRLKCEARNSRDNGQRILISQVTSEDSFTERDSRVCSESESLVRSKLSVNGLSVSLDSSVSYNKLIQRKICPYRKNGRQTPHTLNMGRSLFLAQEWAVLYIQMQLCEETLQHWLERRNSELNAKDGIKGINAEQSIHIFEEVLKGLEYIHSQGIVHRDIKPSNIFVNRSLTEIQLGDFGLACFLSPSSDDIRLISSSSHSTFTNHVGTKTYAAPEQQKGSCSFKSDMYSLGIVLLELMTPFQTGMERSKLIADLKQGALPEDLQECHPHLAQLIHQLTDVDPNIRPDARSTLAYLKGKGIPADHAMNRTISRIERIQELEAMIVMREKEIAEMRKELHGLKRTMKSDFDS